MSDNPRSDRLVASVEPSVRSPVAAELRQLSDDVGGAWLHALAGREELAADLERLAVKAEALEAAVERKNEALRQIAEGFTAGSYKAGVEQLQACARKALGTEGCEHDWVDIRNEVVVSGEMCRKCRALRPGNEATDPA